jgi:hypothetical protein
VIRVPSGGFVHLNAVPVIITSLATFWHIAKGVLVAFQNLAPCVVHSTALEAVMKITHVSISAAYIGALGPGANYVDKYNRSYLGFGLLYGYSFQVLSIFAK